jgi:hypothetical protein
VLRDLIERYLDNLENERAFDATFIALLAAEGYTDIHYLHGPLEFGKDFIAKRNAGTVTEQWMFQNKPGNVATPEMREVKGQILDAVTSSLGHPAFDADLPRVIVLCFTGRFRGNGAVDFQDLARYVKERFPLRTLISWDREMLVGLMLAHGPEQLFRSGIDVAAYGSFFTLYGGILESCIHVDSIQRHFDNRLQAVAGVEQRLVATAIEAHLFADASRQVDQPYCALQAMLAMVRAVLFEMHNADDPHTSTFVSLLRASCLAAAASAAIVAAKYLTAKRTWGVLSEAVDGFAMFVSYPVVCAQFMDGLVILMELGDEQQQKLAAADLVDLVQSEPGCAHPISDRYAVSVVAVIRALVKIGQAATARVFLKEVALWLIDRYWSDGNGLAPCYASELEEISTLLGGPFSGVEGHSDRASLLATALMDCACYVQDESTYTGLRADILAADIVPRYYQVRDTSGQFEFNGKDVIRMPNVDFEATMPAFDAHVHGTHLVGETEHFRIEDDVPAGAYIVSSLLLRDRYFPTTWSRAGKPETATDRS